MKRREVLRYLGAGAAVLHPAVRAFAEVTGRSGDAGKSSGIFLNQLGYTLSGAKQATVCLSDTTRREFQIRSVAQNAGAQDAVVFKGRLGQAISDAASGDQASLADFSTLRTPGVYQLQVGSQGGDPFSIAAQPYAAALRKAMRGFYGQRCGCAVDLGGGYQHPICHVAGAYHATSGKSGPLANHGGWHDAGDYGRYVVNSGISTGTLLWAWELYPEACGGFRWISPRAAASCRTILPRCAGIWSGCSRCRMPMAASGISRRASTSAASSCRRTTR